MLGVVSHKSAAAAHAYYAKGLKREDYYTEGQEVAGKWHGKAAALLGLHGDVMPEALAALVDNCHPETGARLTARTKSDRVVGYDWNFQVPKNVSVSHAFTGVVAS
jgi:conjugative relaxase-like TrwC/TraI family protein